MASAPTASVALRVHLTGTAWCTQVLWEQAAQHFATCLVVEVWTKLWHWNGTPQSRLAKCRRVRSLRPRMQLGLPS